MSTPTKESIIGTYINGRNAQDDFLQLATNHGGTVFAWIDYQGFLQGTFATAANLAVGEVGFGSSTNTLTGDPEFKWDNVGEVLNLINQTPATSVANSNSPSLTFTAQAWDGISSSKTNSFTIQVVNGALLFTTVQNVPVVQSYVFSGTVELLNALTSLGGAALVFASGSAGQVYPVTSVANAVGNLTTYNYTAVSGGQPQGPQNITIAGFVAHAGNNGTFVVQSATLTTVTVYNSGGIAETQAATATLDGTYVGNQGQPGFSYANGNINSAQFPIAGTSYAIPNQFSSLPMTPSFTSIVKGDVVDAGYWRHLNDGATGNHGLEIGSIIDSTGSTPVTFQLGHFNGASSAVLSVPLTVKGTPPTGTTGQISFGGAVGFGNGSSGTAVTTTTKSTGSGPATPQTIVGYYEIDVAGTKAWVPYVQ